uniref:Uncharacterized protein n=1 Tax=Glossina morsitans morsitans TaxID=37546 RepID=A0A1B0FG42_GLOMM
MFQLPSMVTYPRFDYQLLNVAAGKAPMQISTEASGAPQKAIDGSTSAFFTPETCSLTKAERSPWWYVNLLEPYMVQLVRLDFGKSCCGNKPATVVVRVGNNRPDLGTNPICNRFTGLLEEGQPLFLPCNPPMPGAFVSVHLETNIPNQLSICEAFVYTDQALPIERCPSFRDQPPGALASYNGKCYIFYNRQPLNFLDSLSFCRSRGGTLISESNPALQGFISWELWRRHRSDVTSQYWMGAVRDADDRNNWKWVNGEEVTVSFWNHPEGDEDCARFDGSKGWLWSDTNCNTMLNFICQHQPKTCGRPEQPPNSTMIALNGFEVGAQIKYACDSNHLLVGPSTRTCLDTGFYNEFPPVCKYIECGLPASIPHGSYDLINGTVGYLSLVKYSCQEGYEMIGRALLTCDFDERWNGPPPRCEIVECDTLPGNYYNTIISAPNGTYYGSRAEISCPNGYRLEGPRILSCLASGQWSSALPRCIKLEPTTAAPPPSPSTTVTTTTTTTTQKPKTIPTTTTKRPYKISSTTSTTTTTTTSTPNSGGPQHPDLTNEADSDEEVTYVVPGTVREEFPPRRTIRPPVLIPKKPISTPTTHSPTIIYSTSTSKSSSVYIPTRSRTPYIPSTLETTTTTRNTQNILLNAHPQDNEIADSVNIRHNQVPNVNIPYSVENSDRKETKEAKLNLGAIVALGAFGGFVFLAAVITTIVILVRSTTYSIRRHNAKHYPYPPPPPRSLSIPPSSYYIPKSRLRNRTTQHYRHRASPDCNTVASFDSSTSGSRNGLNSMFYRYYRQAWENLHESASKNSSHNALRRKETLDPPNMIRSRDNLRENIQRSRENLERCGRDNYGMRENSEMVVSDACIKGKRL